MSSQLLQETAGENLLQETLKDFTEVYAAKIHSLPIIHEVCHFVTEDDQFGKAGLCLS